MRPKAWIPVLASRAAVSAVRFTAISLCQAQPSCRTQHRVVRGHGDEDVAIALRSRLRLHAAHQHYHPGAAGCGLPSPMKYRCRKLPAVCEISRADTIACVVAGDLNLQAKSLMLLGSIPSPKQNPSNPLRLLGFFINLVAGTGFEPVTFRL